MRPSRGSLGLVWLALVALSLRLGLVWAVSGEQGEAATYTYEHGEIAENLLAGCGFTAKFLGVTGSTSQQAPFYPLFLATAYKLFGVGSPAAILAVRCVQSVAGTLLVLLVVWLSWSLIPQRRSLGWIAGYGAAVYPTHVYMVTHMQVAIWAALLLTLLVAVVASPAARHSVFKAALAGALAGALLLVEPILAIALPIVALMFWRADQEVGGAEPAVCESAATGRRSSTAGRSAGPFATPIGRVATMAGVAVLVIAPWLWRNFKVHGEIVFIKSTLGYAFWQGNNPISWGTDKIPQAAAETVRLAHDGTLSGVHRAMNDARLETTYIDDIALAPGGHREFQGLSEPARSRLLSARAWEFIRREPERYLGLCLRRLGYLLLFDETNPKAANVVYRVSTVVWLTLASAGLVVLRSQWRRIAGTAAIFATVVAFHTLTIVSARFRIPIEPLSFVWAAAGLAALADRIATRARMPGVS